MSLYKFNNASIGVGTYAGEAARPYVAAAILSADTIANNYVSVLQNVHSKAVLRKFSGAAIQANDDCAFSTAAGQLTLGEAVLATSPLKVNEQVCNEDLRATWESAQMSGQNSAAPADFTTYVAQYVAAKVAENVEINIWGGNYDPTDGGNTGAGRLGTSFDGLCHQLVDATPGYEKLGSGAFTADNAATTGILTRLDDIVDNAPSEVQGDSNAVIYMSKKSLFLLQRAMSGLTVTNGSGYAAAFSPTFLGEGRPLTYLGFPIVCPAGMANDTIIFCNPNQLYFGTDLLTDHVNASILNLRDVTGDDVTRVIMQFSGGTQIVDEGSIAISRRNG
mgnify:CR=1 FL=1|tara:strand:+ start:1511 stop:2512 length:1002 start_codon:yes stop_codon:yes gene_type:complete